MNRASALRRHSFKTNFKAKHGNSILKYALQNFVKDQPTEERYIDFPKISP